MKENDILLGRFADQQIEKLDATQLAQYEQFMQENDIDILNWLTGKETPPDHLDRPLLQLIKKANNL